MYERLTKRFLGSNAPYTEFADYNEILNRLCEIADKICEGRMVELPFKLGGRKRLYYPVKGTNTILETRVFGIGIDDEGDVIFNPTEYPEKVIEMRGVEIGKTVFLTPEEANKKLKELENEQR